MGPFVIKATVSKQNTPKTMPIDEKTKNNARPAIDERRENVVCVLLAALANDANAFRMDVLQL